MGNYRVYTVDDNGVVRGEIYYTIPYEGYLAIEMELDTTTNLVTIIAHSSDYRLDELNAIDGWTMVIE